MNEKMAVVCGTIGAVGSFIAQFLGGWDNAVLALLIFMAAMGILVNISKSADI